MSNIALRGAVYSKFKTIAAFADSIGWKYNRANRIVNGIQEPNVNEILDIANTLEIENTQEFMRIFFESLSTKWT